MKGGHMFTKGAILKAKILFPIILCGIMVFWSFQASGEEWTDAQKEVWNVIEDRWIRVVEGDLKTLEAGIHDDAISWRFNKSDPFGKISINRLYERWISYSRPVTYELKPHAIQILGDIANVFYSYRWKAKEKYSGHNRALMSFKKQEGKWLIISSFSASCEKLPQCLD
jgi:ketosteroid isomerase-like protein